MRFALLAMTGILAASPAIQADVALQGFEDITQWAGNRDGGNAPEITADTGYMHEGQGMRIKYTDAPPHWGNLTGPCTIPPEARALRFWVYKHSCEPAAVMHIWLFEPDGDAWLQKVFPGGKDLVELPEGWHLARVPVAGFRFDPRGSRNREMLSVNRMLIGCNYGDLEVTVDSMIWETGPGGEPLPLPRTQDLSINAGEAGNVGILDMGGALPGGFEPAHRPNELAAALTNLGFGATVLRAGDLADPETLTLDNFDAVVLPCGPYFPAEAADAFVAYLRAGGSFLSTDGYALDELLFLTERGWAAVGAEVTAAEMDNTADKPALRRLNTRVGKPGDAMSLEPEQIGVFDPQFPLQHADQFRATGCYAQLGAVPVYQFSEPVEGFSASGLTGVNSPVFPEVYRRWIPVLEAVESKSGVVRGTALSIMHNFSGHYRGSSWAFSGITSGQDIFLGDANRRSLLGRVMRDITEKVYVQALVSDLACYEPGETAKLTATVVNFGKRAAIRKLAVEVGDDSVLDRDLSIEPGASVTVEVSVSVDDLGALDLVPCAAVLSEGERIADRFDTAFCVRNEAVLASGPKVAWEGNYLTVDGRANFLVGTNQTGMMYFSANETPAIWDRDFRSMAEQDFHIMRILHFSPYSKGGYEGRPTNNPLDLAERPLRLVRQMDAIVQLAQKHRVAIFLALHDWMGVTLTDQELASQRDWNRFWTERYKSVPGIFYDVQNEPSVDVPDRPDVVALWNAFLQERYGSSEALRAAWTISPPEADLPNVPIGKATGEWADVRAADRKRFETELLNRWVKVNVDGIREGDPDAIVCVGYLPSMPPADKILGVRHTDFSNMHYYGSTDRMQLELKPIDRRFAGKGFSLGEFGAQEAHDARVNGNYGVPVEASVQRFQSYIHYAAGMGAAFMANWDWKDFDECVFPWGLMHHGTNLAKPWLNTLQQASLLLTTSELKYESPSVFILAPDSHRIGPRFNDLHGALQNCVAGLLDRRVDFGVINEEDIEGLPESARVIFWPVPYCPDDATFEMVRQWVEAGGTLCFTGGIGFDRTRKPTRSERYAALGLPAEEPVKPFETPDQAWERDVIEGAAGQGKVLFAPYPAELRGSGSLAGLYARALEVAGIEPIAVEPADAPVRAQSVPTAGGGRVYMVARTGGAEDRLRITLPAAGVTLELSQGGSAFVITGAQGEIIAAESQGAVSIGDVLLAEASGYFGICALDGKDLRASRRILVLPHQCEEVWLGAVAGEAGLQVMRVTPGLADSAAVALGRALNFAPGAGGQIALIAPAAEMAQARQQLSGMTNLRVAAVAD